MIAGEICCDAGRDALIESGKYPFAPRSLFLSTTTSADARLELTDFERLAPEARAALSAVSKAASDSGLDKGLLELVKIRASQINGCAFCVQFHLNLARRLAVEQRKLDLLAAWHDAGVFSPREMAALAWTEALTHLSPASVSDEAWARVREVFSENEAVFLTVAIASIQAWNRIAMALRFTPPAG
jgi:AhpD family alkylhydroperoxidase